MTRRRTKSLDGWAVSLAAGLVGLGLPWIAAAAPLVEDRPEPRIAARGEIGEYLRELHTRLHKRWAVGFVGSVSTQLPATNPLNDLSKRVQLQVVASRDGSSMNVRMLSKSGISDMDDAVVEMVEDSAPWPPAPNDALSDDGRAYLVWTFARDHRLCSGVEVIQRESPLAEAVPRLIDQDRAPEAWRRVRAAAAASPEPGLSQYAHLWLARVMTSQDSRLAAAAAAALLGTGDSSGVETLRRAVRAGVPYTSVNAARALFTAKIPVCPLLTENLKGTGPYLETAVAILGLKLEPECAPALLAIVENTKAPTALRLTAFKLLIDNNAVEAPKAIAAASGDSVAALKGAGLLATIKPGAGRTGMFRLVPFLKESAMEMRAAASAGLVRTAGDLAIEQLYLLFKEPDLLPYELVAAELGKYATPATAEFLTKIGRRDDPRIKVAVAKAAAARTDGPARQLLATLAGDANAEVRAIASPPPTTAELARQAGALPSAAGRQVYRALLGSPGGRPAALAWMLANFSLLDAATQAEVLGEWMAPPAVLAGMASLRAK